MSQVQRRQSAQHPRLRRLRDLASRLRAGCSARALPRSRWCSELAVRSEPD